MAILFEYNNEEIVDNPNALKEYLRAIWVDQYAPLINELGEPSSENELLNDHSYQPFLRFDGKFIRANNYVGFIQNGNLNLEIYPKVFKSHQASPILMLRHLFFWFDYCRKWKFPFTKSKLDSLDDLELPELIIYLMASKILETVSTFPISLYQPIGESLMSPKGRINFSRYLASGFINGNQHIIDCDHEPFIFDNSFNKVIKYVSRVLFNKTRYDESRSILQELIFILDEVEDKPCTYLELETIVLNPLFAEYQDIKDICKIVLQQLLYANQQYDLTQWSLLFPMEYIFEDFVAGFLDSRFSTNWKVEYQKSNINLSSKPEVFQMQHDIFLTSRSDNSKKIIIDTKYKLRDRDFKSDKKKGVAQSDLYQMVSYAFRRGCNQVLLLYPNIDEDLHHLDSFIIESGFKGKDAISIIAAEIPFWSINGFENLPDSLENSLKKILKNYE